MPPKRPARNQGQRGKSTKKRKEQQLPPTDVPVTVNDPHRDPPHRVVNSDTGTLSAASIVEAVLVELEKRGVVPPASTVPSSTGIPSTCTYNSQTPSLPSVPTSSHVSQTDTIATCSQTPEACVTDSVRQALFMTTEVNSSSPTQGGSTCTAGTNIVSLNSSALPIGALVPEKTKLCIWNNEFIDLTSLIDKRYNNDEVTLTFSATGHNISVSAKEESKNLTIGKWLSAFTIYMDIYIQRYPKEASGLLSYICMMRDLERVHGVAAFNFYDRNFRAHRQCQPLAWGALHHELWIRATTMANSTQARSAPSKFCYKYNKPLGCQVRNCAYDHVCGHCQKPHPQFRCFARPAQRGVQSHNAAASGSFSNLKSTNNTSQNQPFRSNPSKK